MVVGVDDLYVDVRHDPRRPRANATTTKFVVVAWSDVVVQLKICLISHREAAALP